VATRTRIRDSRSDRIFTAWNVTILTLFTVSVLYPLVYIVSASISNPHAVNSGKMWLWPVQVTIQGYRTVFAYHEIVTGFLNSLFYAVVGAAFSVSLTLLAAYPLSRRDLFGRGPIMVFFLIPMVFSGGMIPTYLVVHQLGLLNTRWALVIPAAVSVFQVIITRTFFQVSIPEELLEAARVDGCSDFRFFFRMVLPLSKPIIAVNALFYAVGQWNSWFNALIYLTNQHLFPLQLVLRQILILNSVDPSQVTDASLLAHQQALQDLLKYGLIVIASIPPLLAYPFVQKHFVKGMMIGSLKG
jgi:multiple sugar transport system permease protein/putative aldouronate transport system permease protein